MAFGVLAFGALAFGLLGACGDGGAEGSAENAAAEPGSSPRDITPGAGAPASFGHYRFVEAPEGMLVEAVGADSVQTVSCPARTCPGLCDECAAAACRAAGELEAACAALSASCLDACNCETGGMGCGFPVCVSDRQLCYLVDGLEAVAPGVGPAGPAPDPSPPGVDRPESPSGSGASRPVPVP